MPRSLIRWAHRRLLAHYGQPIWDSRNEPLDELVGTILSQHTSDLNSARAFKALRSAYTSWEAVRDAPEAELIDAIHAGGLAVVKAARIQAVLRALSPSPAAAPSSPSPAAAGEGIKLPDFRRMPRKKAIAFLTALPGVGRKTAACVLLFGSHVPAIPVDTHVHRVSLRVGFVPPHATPDAACDLLEAAIPPAEQYAFHINLIRLGRDICKAQRPRCGLCPLESRCAFAHRVA
jgi:endonuclease-3